ncbi:MAG: hypothetical protein RR782_02680 [Clostridium sp.]
MKKILSIILLSIFLVGCGSQTGEVVPSEQPKENIVKVGDTIKTATKEIKINKVEFANKVEGDVDGFQYFDAKDGNILIHIDADVKNIGETETMVDKVASVGAKYDSKYSYEGYSVAEDKQAGLNYSNIVAIEPLSTLGVRYLVDVPKEVEKSSKPLNVILNVDGGEYIIKVR